MMPGQNNQNVVMKNRQNVLKQVNQIKSNAKISAESTQSGKMVGQSTNNNLPLISQTSLQNQNKTDGNPNFKQNNN